MTSYQLQDKVAVVTGAASGINRAIALRLAEEGADVVIADVDLAGAADTEAGVRAAGARPLVVRTDVRKRDDLDAMVVAALEQFGHIDVLVNGAGIETLIPFIDLTEAEWNRVLGVNLTGAFLCGQVVAREMIRAGRAARL